jgi:hypothetical protein
MYFHLGQPSHHEAGAAVLLVATDVVVGGYSSEAGTGPTRPGPTPANVVPGGTAAPSITVITPSPHHESPAQCHLRIISVLPPYRDAGNRR